MTALSSNRLDGANTPGITGQEPLSNPICNKADVNDALTPALSVVNAATANTTAQLAAIFFTKNGKMAGSPTCDTTTLVIPRAANAVARDVVINNSDHGVAAIANPTAFLVGVISSFGKTGGATRTGISPAVFRSNVAAAAGGGGGVSPKEMVEAPPGTLTTLVLGLFKVISLLVNVDMALKSCKSINMKSKTKCFQSQLMQTNFICK